MRIAFLGTPEFAVPSLAMLLGDGHTLAVFTQPDRPVGRHGTLTPPPAKVFAAEHGLPVYQFEKIRSPEGVAALRAFNPDFMVTAAFGQILSKENLDVPRFGCINVHGSLLPKYRGAAPVAWAIVDGETTTGITTMLTDVGLDTGDILLQRETDIGPDETAGELAARLAELGADVLMDTLILHSAGFLQRKPQDEALATKCRTLKKEDGKLDFSLPAQRVHDHVRGMNPWPGAFALLSGEPLKIWRTRTTDDCGRDDRVCGELFGSDRTGLFVRCADRMLEILELQTAGGKRLDGKTFLRGCNIAGRVLA